MLQDMGCGNNVTRVLPPCLLKSGFVDCLFEGKEASDKHPVLKSSLDFAAEQGGRVIPCRGERLKNVEEQSGASGGHGRAVLIRLSCPVQFSGF